MAAEVAGLAGDVASMHEIVTSAVRILDAVDRQEMAPISLASTYHKLSSVYIKVICQLGSYESILLFAFVIVLFVLIYVMTS